MADLESRGIAYEAVSCLGQCDRAPATLDEDLNVVAQTTDHAGITPNDIHLPMNLGGTPCCDGEALRQAQQMGPDAVLEQLERAGLQGRGGAGFAAHVKWRSVRQQAETERYVVCNADEGEPGTFKDREIMLRRADLVIEGLAITAATVGAENIYIYIRGEFRAARAALEQALHVASYADAFRFHFVDGHGAYICGEETALIESLEGKRGMPRLKPPYPTECGFRGKPTLMHNVETVACVPAIILRGGEAFRQHGRTEPGSKLYCISGHIRHPGVYELPLGICLDELVEVAGGYIGTPLAFSPGGASSGFLPMTERQRPLDYRHLAEVGSMLGSAGVVVLNDGVDLAEAVRWQLLFFEDESCGQCAPCRIGTRYLHNSLQGYLKTGQVATLQHAEAVGWEMEEGSICGLGMVAAKPLESARKYFPQVFAQRNQVTGNTVQPAVKRPEEAS
ncbi:MAG: NADH-ubiquinone oxidoreductase-F iron-sulfur binding region domain-containing protein [Myxococcota bacterium]